MNCRVYYRTQQQNNTFVLFKGKEGWGTRYNSMSEIIKLLQEIKEENNDCYWSQNIQAWTYPGLCSYEEAKRKEHDWKKVEYRVFLDEVEI